MWFLILCVYFSIVQFSNANATAVPDFEPTIVQDHFRIATEEQRSNPRNPPRSTKMIKTPRIVSEYYARDA